MSIKSNIHNSITNVTVEELYINNSLINALGGSNSRFEELKFIISLARKACRINRFFPRFRESSSPSIQCDKLSNDIEEYYRKSKIVERDSSIVNEEDKEFVYTTLFSMIYTIQDISTNSTKVFSCTNIKEREDFNKYIGNNKTKLLFHGTNISNLYSILRTGLRSMSGTSLESHGAVYGNGVYMSNNFSTALGYSRENTKCILVFEVSYNEEPKSDDYFVIDEGKYLLKCIIVGEVFNVENKSLLEMLTKKFIVDKTPVRNTGNELKLSKRFIKELGHLLSKSTDDEDLQIREISYDDSDITKPITLKFTPDMESVLYEQMKKYNVDGITIEIRLPVDYPFKPPFIRVCFPRFEFLTGHVTLGGSFCNELLTTSGWAPSNLLITIIRLLSVELTDTRDGKCARLDVDRTRRGIHYTYQEAKEAYVRMATNHNWKIDI